VESSRRWLAQTRDRGRGMWSMNKLALLGWCSHGVGPYWYGGTQRAGTRDLHGVRLYSKIMGMLMFATVAQQLVFGHSQRRF
jgi:hypothetical protein